MTDNRYSLVLTEADLAEINRILDRIFARDPGYVCGHVLSAIEARLALLRDEADRKQWPQPPAQHRSVQ